MEEQKTLNEVELLKQALKNCHFMYVQQQLAILNALKTKFGPEVVEIVEHVNGEEICQTYLRKIQNPGERTIDDLINVLWEPLRNRGYEFTIERSEKGVQMECTVCPLANLYKALGGTDWGYHLYCSADEYLVKGFNPKIGFKRLKTLMEGHNCCDHFYFIKD